MNNFRFTIFCVLCAGVIVTFAANSTDSTEKTLDFVNKARAKLKLTNSPDIILVVGTTGVGKSTTVHCVATECSKVISIETDTEYIVQDSLDVEQGDIKSTSASRTLTPEMIIDRSGNVWYDCPGFGDTRNETVEIATTFLIKSVIENASNIKIVLVVDYDSVTKGHNRDGFDRLLSRTTQLIKNVRHFQNSVSLVVTKTPSSFSKKKGKKFISVDIKDNSVKKSTVQFAREHRSFLEEKGSNEQKIS